MSVLDASATAASEPSRTAGGRTWILVLPVAPESLAAVEERVAARGWELEVSPGEEQVVAAVHGPRARAELAAALPPEASIEVVALRTGREYRRQRARQGFLSGMGLGLALLALVAFALPVLGFLEPPDVPLSAPSEVLVATVDELPPNAALRARMQEQPILVVHTGRERFHALSARCTHMDACLLEWSGERRQIVCPCHGCVYDVWGNVIQGPPSVPLRTFAVERRGAALYVRVGGVR